MQLSLDTYCKSAGERKSSEVGRCEVTVSEQSYRALESLEERLRDSNKDELLADIDDAALDIEVPDAIDGLKDCQVRLYLDGEEQVAHFHLVGRQANDDSLVYTSSVLVRMVAV